MPLLSKIQQHLPPLLFRVILKVHTSSVWLKDTRCINSRAKLWEEGRHIRPTTTAATSTSHISCMHPGHDMRWWSNSTTSKSHYDPYYFSSEGLTRDRPLFNYKQTIFGNIWEPQILYPCPAPPAPPPACSSSAADRGHGYSF